MFGRGGPGSGRVSNLCHGDESRSVELKNVTRLDSGGRRGILDVAIIAGDNFDQCSPDVVARIGMIRTQIASGECRS